MSRLQRSTRHWQSYSGTQYKTIRTIILCDVGLLVAFTLFLPLEFSYIRLWSLESIFALYFYDIFQTQFPLLHPGPHTPCGYISPEAKCWRCRGASLRRRISRNSKPLATSPCTFHSLSIPPEGIYRLLGSCNGFHSIAGTSSEKERETFRWNSATVEQQRT